MLRRRLLELAAAASDGYPNRIFDKPTGPIDREVASRRREKFDVRHTMERGGARLGPRVGGRIHIYFGAMDTCYPSNAVYPAEESLKQTRNPPAGAQVRPGGPTAPNCIVRLPGNTTCVPAILKRIEPNHPPGANLKSCRDSILVPTPLT